MDRPNVLLLYTDQQRWDALGCAGNPHVRTPNLDALAAEGACFDHAFCNAPTCMPSRASLLSGRYPPGTGVTVNGIEMPEDVPCLQHLLAPYGYHTANIGKLHFRCHSTRRHQDPHPAYGFDTLILSDEPGCYDDAYVAWVRARDPGIVEACRTDTPDAWQGAPRRGRGRGLLRPYAFEGPEALTHTAFVADETCAFLERRRADRFFCVAGFYAPHPPLNPPRRFVDMYDTASLPLPVRAEHENYRDVTDEQWRRIKAFYYAQVSHIDDQVGRILQTLDACGLSENTIVVFTSDHGEHLGDHGLVSKGSPLDSSSRVPLVVRYPRAVEAGTARSELVEAVDLAPTILDWCGVQAPGFVQGRSVAPLLAGGEYTPRQSAFMMMRIPFGSSYKAVRTREALYAAWREGEDLRELLYDLAADPHELYDVAGDTGREALLHAMRTELVRRWFDVEPQYPLRTGAY